MKLLITKHIEIDMGHRVPNHKSKCRNLHGHRYKIEVGVDDVVITTPGTSDEGMVIDFGDVKKLMMDIIDEKYDHGFVMYHQDEFADIFDRLLLKGQRIIFVPFIPTAENLAKHWFDLLEAPLKYLKINLHHVKVWETPTSTATFTKHDKRSGKIDTSQKKLI